MAKQSGVPIHALDGPSASRQALGMTHNCTGRVTSPVGGVADSLMSISQKRRKLGARAVKRVCVRGT